MTQLTPLEEGFFVVSFSEREGFTIEKMFFILLAFEFGDAQFVPPETLEARALGEDWAEVGRVFSPLKEQGNWEFLGPRPITGESWSDGVVSGRVSFVLPHPTDEQVIYIAAAQGGVWRTTDGGQTWEPLTDGLTSLSSGALAFEPGNPSVIYYGTGEMHFSGDCAPGDGLFRSADGGQTWEKVAGRNTVGQYISKVIVDPEDPQVILVASNLGVLRSSDGGNTWTATLGASWATDLVIRPDSPKVLYAGILSSGVYKSVDGGQTWEKLSGGLPTDGFSRIQLAIAPSQPRTIYASFTSSDWRSLKGLWRSDDGGETWTQLPAPDYLYPQGFYDHTVAVDPQNPDIIYAGGVYPYNSSIHGLVKSEDGGQTWEDITVGSPGILHPDIHHLAFDAAGDLWVACDGGVWESTDGGQSWVNHNRDLAVTQFYTVAVSPQDPDLVQGGTQDNGTPRELNGLEWGMLSGGDGGPTTFLWGDPAVSFSSYVFLNPLWKFRDWTYQGTVTGPWSGDRASWCNGPLVVDPIDPLTIYAGTHRVWRTTNAGASWTAISGDLAGGTGYLLAIAVAPSDNRVIYAGSNLGHLFVTRDGGQTWESIRDLGAWGGAAVEDIAVNPRNPDDVYILTSNGSPSQRGVWHSEDGGQTWEHLQGNMESLAPRYFFALEIDFSVPVPILLVGSRQGVLISRDMGSTWERLEGLPYVDVYELYLDPDDRILYAATHGRGMWRTQIMDQDEEATRKPERGSATYWAGVLKFSLPNAGQGGIYDVSGRALWRGWFPEKGSLKLNLKPGVYFLKVRNTTLSFPVMP